MFETAIHAIVGRLVRGDFVIRHRPGRGVSVRGRVPRGKVGMISEFFRRDLNPPGPVTVWGSWSGGRGRGVLRLRFLGRLDGADRQRARNFLSEHLA